jgi:hypothetical protein
MEHWMKDFVMGGRRARHEVLEALLEDQNQIQPKNESNIQMLFPKSNLRTIIFSARPPSTKSNGN